MVLAKKSDGTYRVCVKFKELNKITVFDPESMMSPDDIFPKLSGSQFYSTFDFSKGYWAIPMEKNTSKDYTTVVTSCGLMRFKVMLFGMVNSRSTYNRKMMKFTRRSTELGELIYRWCDWSEHVNVLRDFFERVRNANLSLRPSKCKIG